MHELACVDGDHIFLGTTRTILLLSYAQRTLFITSTAMCALFLAAAIEFFVSICVIDYSFGLFNKMSLTSESVCGYRPMPTFTHVRPPMCFGAPRAYAFFPNVCVFVFKCCVMSYSGQSHFAVVYEKAQMQNCQARGYMDNSHIKKFKLSRNR